MTGIRENPDKLAENRHARVHVLQQQPLREIHFRGDGLSEISEERPHLGFLHAEFS